MSEFISKELATIIERIPERSYNPKEILEAFKSCIDDVAKLHNVIYYKSFIVQPYNVRANKPGEKEHMLLFDNTNGCETENYVVRFDIGSGGFVEITSGIKKGEVWTEEAKKDSYILARLIYLLFGRARAMHALEQMSFYDSMTGIPNITMLNKVIAKTFEQGGQIGYCGNFINIKNMKILNNRYTQVNGDRLIVMYANKLVEFVGQDGLVARLGGDNFVIFIKRIRENELLEYLKNIEVTLKLAEGNELTVKLEARAGYYFLDEKTTPVDVIRNCDIALRYARNDEEADYVMFVESMKSGMLRIKQLEENIPFAIKNKEFRIYYQPKADISDADDFKLVGAEALVRWYKDDEVISPGEFIPVLERNGMVTLVDFYVFENVCKAIKDWEKRGLKPVRISSNFSRRHLFDECFADKVEDIVRRYEVDPKYLEIEITESYDNEDMYALKEFERRMHQIGLKLTVDDFGSGFSSIKMLKNIVSDTVKLDKSIVDDIGTGDDGSDNIIKYIIQMILSLGKDIIAEGVEYKHQADYLRENGCNKIQGYMYGRPMPINEFEEYMDKI